MRGRTNVGGGSGVISSTVISGVVKSGEHISAGNFVECVNANNQTPIRMDTKDDMCAMRKYIYKLSDGRFVIFYGALENKGSVIYTQGDANYKYASVFTVADDRPTLNFSTMFSTAVKTISSFWVAEVTTNTFALVTMEKADGQYNAWYLVIRKCVVDVTNNAISYTTVGTIDISAQFPNASYSADFASQKVTDITACSLEDGQNIVVFYGHTSKTVYCNIIDVINETIGTQQSFVVDDTIYNRTYNNSASASAYQSAPTSKGDPYAYKALCIASGKIVFKYCRGTDTTPSCYFVVLGVSSSTITKLYESSAPIVGFSCHMLKVAANKFCYVTTNGAATASGGAITFFTLLNDNSLQYISLTLTLAQLCSNTSSLFDVVPALYDSDTLYLLTTVPGNSFPACISKVDISDYSDPIVGEYEELQILSDESSIRPFTAGAFLMDSVAHRGLYMFAPNPSNTQWVASAPFYCAVKLINNAVLPTGDQLVFTKHVKSIAGVSKTAGNGGDTIQVYIPDPEE